ncbi:MAG: FAD-dependent oxidoreductase [Deltaproteobacteria bacterium]|nr:FAD-dependent oxidoreductase [Deltaproteobacteria bacterium]
MSEQIFDVAVLGSGPAGLTAAIYAHRAGLSTLVVGGDHPGGKVMMHPHIENYPPFPEGVTGAELMIRWVKQVADEVGEGPRPEMVTKVDLAGAVKTIEAEGGTYQARTVIVATGASGRKLGVKGEEELAGRGVFSCAMCDAPLLRTLKRQRAVVVGGGDTAVHTGQGLLPHAEAVTLITRGPALRAQPVLVDRFLADPKAGCRFQRQVVAIHGGSWVAGVSLKDPATGAIEEMEIDAVFVGIGQVPSTGFLQGALATDEEGFLVVDGDLACSLPGVFAAGDVRVSPLRQIITAASDGALAAKSATDYLAAAEI